MINFSKGKKKLVYCENTFLLSQSASKPYSMKSSSVLFANQLKNHQTKGFEIVNVDFKKVNCCGLKPVATAGDV